MVLDQVHDPAHQEHAEPAIAAGLDMPADVDIGELLGIESLAMILDVDAEGVAIDGQDQLDGGRARRLVGVAEGGLPTGPAAYL